jgi:Xaa-Pro aminopeptidase
VTAFLFLLVSITSFAVERQPSSDYHARREALAKKANAAVLVFAGTEAAGQNDLYGFRQDNNFYYLTGWTEPGAAILVAPARAATDSQAALPYTEILFLPAHNYTQERWTGPKLGAENPQAPQLTGVDHVEVLDRLRDELVRVLPAPIATIYVNFGDISASSMAWLTRTNAFPNYISTQDADPLIAELRVRKDQGEIELIRKATQASMAGHVAAMKEMHPHTGERQIAALMQYEFTKRGCERPAYAPIVGAGYNSTVLHYSDDDGPIRDGDVVVMDVAGEYSMYASDITRTLPANGKFMPRQREIYEIVLGAQQAAMDAFQSGKSSLSRSAHNSLYKVAYDYINSHGKDLHGQPLGQYFIHGLGHFVGLEVHDVGDNAQPLGPGMVFTIEPGIYIPEEKIGVRIEDIFYVDNNGKLIRFTEGLPRTVEEVEAAMRAH